MNRLLLLTGFTLLVSMPALSQEPAPRSEISGGYTYFRTEGGGSLHGWNGSVAASLNRWFGLVADFSGHYGSSSSAISIGSVGVPDFSSRSSVDTSIHTFLVGPRFSYRNHDRITPFGHALAGASRIHVKGFAQITSPPFGDTEVSFNDSNTGFAMGLGGGLDVKMTRSFALRLIQADYLMTAFAGNIQNNARISVGFVYRFDTN